MSHLRLPDGVTQNRFETCICRTLKPDEPERKVLETHASGECSGRSNRCDRVV